MFCSCWISTDKCLARSICNSRIFCWVFKPNVQNIVKATAVIATKFCAMVKTSKDSLWIFTKCTLYKPRWLSAAILNKNKSLYLSNRVTNVSVPVKDFWGRVYIVLHFGNQITPKTFILGAGIGLFKPNMQKYLNFRTIKATAAMQPNFTYL